MKLDKTSVNIIMAGLSIIALGVFYGYQISTVKAYDEDKQYKNPLNPQYIGSVENSRIITFDTPEGTFLASESFIDDKWVITSITKYK